MISLYTRRIKTDPENEGNYLYLGSLGLWGMEQYSRGAYEEAELLSLKTLEIRRRVLGEEHPDTVKSINNLVMLYEAWGKPSRPRNGGQFCKEEHHNRLSQRQLMDIMTIWILTELV